MTTSSTILGAGTREREDQGACLTAPGSSPLGDAPDGSSSQATAIPSRGLVDPAVLAEGLARLSAAATQGRLWAAAEVEYRVEPTDERWYISQGRGNLSGCEVNKDDALFWVALVNAYRSGDLAPAFAAAIPSGETSSTDWLDQPIGSELAFEGMNFGKGIPLRVVINAAQRWRRDALAVFNNTNPIGIVQTPNALAGETAVAAETCKGSVEDERAADLSATPQVSISSPPNPPPTLTVEEAREVLEGPFFHGTAKAQAAWLRYCAEEWRFFPGKAQRYRDDASRIETALRLLADQDNSEGRDA